MELSMVIAIVASLVLLQYLPAIVITFFALLSEFAEGFIVEKRRRNIHALYDLAPRKAIVKSKGNDGEGEERKELQQQTSTTTFATTTIDAIDVDKVKVGDIVIVREGDIIPVDGKIVNGSSVVNQSSITGESIPVDKSEGDSVFAGTINQSHQIEVICEKVSTDTTFAKIIHLVDEAEASKAPIQKLTDKMATRLIQFAIALSALTYILRQNVVSSLSVIVVAGACGLAVGTPIALLATTGKLSRKGIIAKGGLQIENLKRTSVVVFDKTGTLTYGKPVVAQVISFDPSHHHIQPKQVLEYAAIAESNVNHPLAIAVLEKARKEGIILSPMRRDVVIGSNNNDDNGSSISSNSSIVTVGKGVTRLYKGRRITLGNLRQMKHSWMPDELMSSSSLSSSSSYDRLQSPQELILYNRQGTTSYLHPSNIVNESKKEEDRTIDDGLNFATTTTSYVAVDNKVIGAILFKDELRSEAREAISQLKSMGIHVIMLTGDNEKITEQIADEVGIHEYYAELLPQHKVSKIEEIVEREQSKGSTKNKKNSNIVMVGDGINDAPALAKADVGIAMGKTGTDVAIETADVVLMTEDLKKIPYLIRASRQSILAIRENFYGTLSVDGIGFILAATSHLNPLMAAFIHIVSEFVFMVNSARLIIE